MPERKPRTAIGLLSVLAEDDRVEVRDDQGFRWTGVVDVSAPELGVVWIFTDNGERKAVDIYDFTIETRWPSNKDK
jgi:hypothetical protein